jgi:methyl-accepting chemotaxis protein
LAQRSTQSASEIACLIKDSVDSIAGAKALVEGAGGSMDEIMVRVGEATAIMSAICEACRVQSEGLTRVNRSMGGLDATVQQNAALVEEAAAASMHLEQQSKRLQETVKVFRLSDE